MHAFQSACGSCLTRESSLYHIHAAVNCGLPPSINNGQFSASATTFQSVATYTCSEGYEFPSGAQEMSITCEANMAWSTPTPQCQRKCD